MSAGVLSAKLRSSVWHIPCVQPQPHLLDARPSGYPVATVSVLALQWAHPPQGSHHHVPRWMCVHAAKV